MKDKNTRVTLVGLGPMGQSMGSVLLENGYNLTIWNRTPARAESLIAQGARLADSPGDAVGASDLVILSLTDYQAMYDILSVAGSKFSGRTIVNLSSGEPNATREAAAWVTERGGTLISGGVMASAPLIGTDAAYVYYSGLKASFDAHERVLRSIGQPRYLGEDVGLAQLFYLANLEVFLASLSGLLHASALANSAGVKTSLILPELVQTLIGAGEMVAASGDLGSDIDNGHHPGDQASALMMGVSADHILAASRAAGIDLSLPASIKSHYDAAITDGRGGESWTVLIEFMKRRGLN